MKYALDENVRELAQAFGRDAKEIGLKADAAVGDASQALVVADNAADTASAAQNVAAALAPYKDRATAEAANVPHPIGRIGVFAPNGDTLWYKRDAAGTALTTGDGSKWSPDGDVYPDHYGAVADAKTGSDGNTTAASTTFTSATAAFTANDVGKSIVIQNAGTDVKRRLATTIVAVNSPTRVELADAATSSESDVWWTYGTDVQAKWQAAADHVEAIGGGMIRARGNHMLMQPIYLGSNTTVDPGALGALTLHHPNQHCFKAKYPNAVGSEKISIRNVVFDAGHTADGAISMDGVRVLRVLNCHITKVKWFEDNGTPAVTICVGIGQKSGGAVSGDIEVLGGYMDAPDYGVVIESGTGNPAIEKVRVIGVNIRVGYGSGVSISRFVRDFTITGNNFDIGHIDPEDTDGVRALGVKIWNGTSPNFCPADGTISGNTFKGVPDANKNTDAISIGNYSHSIAVGPNTARDLKNYVKLSYLYNARGITVTGGTVRNCTNVIEGIAHIGRPVVTGVHAYDIDYFAYGVVGGGTFSGCQMENVGVTAIHVIGDASYTKIIGCTADQIQRSFADFTAGTNAAGITLNDNTIEDAGLEANNTYDVLALGSNSEFVVVGNRIRSNGANKPRHILGGTGTHRLFNSNWLFGAATGYYQTAAAASDVFIGNKERGL